MIGGGVIALGLFLAYNSQQKGKTVPFIGGFLPTKKTATVVTPA